jgi:hypothetical protein
MSMMDGRGRWYRWDSKKTVGDFLCFDVVQVANGIDLDRAGMYGWTWSWSAAWGEARYASISFDVVPGRGLRLRYTHNGEDVDPYWVGITYTDPHYGGKRPWFVCPNTKCNRRVRKLYGGMYFLCRTCHDLTYKVCQSSKVEAVGVSIANRIHAIRRRLGGTGGLEDSFPDKPRYMHWCTYTRLIREGTILQGLWADHMSASLFAFVGDAPGMDSLAIDAKEVLRYIQRDWRQIRAGDLGDDWLPDSWEDDEERAPRPERLTLGQLASRADVPYAFAQEVVREELLRPDRGRTGRRKRYRPRLASWLVKLQTLRDSGLLWDDIRAWTRRRWEPGHEHERRWPAGFVNVEGGDQPG